jgi:hypothetical protein
MKHRLWEFTVPASTFRILNLVKFLNEDEGVCGISNGYGFNDVNFHRISSIAYETNKALKRA